jgi:hypothetical protein
VNERVVGKAPELAAPFSFGPLSVPTEGVVEDIYARAYHMTKTGRWPSKHPNFEEVRTSSGGLHRYALAGTTLPERPSIPATAVVRVLQRVAELQAERVRFCAVNGRYLSIKADGWTLICGLVSGDLDGLYHCTTPDGEYLGMQDWSIEADPIDMLGDATAWQVVQRFYRECRT